MPLEPERGNEVCAGPMMVCVVYEMNMMGGGMQRAVHEVTGLHAQEDRGVHTQEDRQMLACSQRAARSVTGGKLRLHSIAVINSVAGFIGRKN